MAKQTNSDDTKKYNSPKPTNKPKAQPAKKEPEKKPSIFPIEPADLVKIIKGEIERPEIFRRVTFNRIQINFPPEFTPKTEEEVVSVINLYTGEIRKEFTKALIPKTKIVFLVNRKPYHSSTN